MDILSEQSATLVRTIDTVNRRYLYDHIAWSNRLIGIKGARGTGKTTILLQRINELGLSPSEAIYLSLDDLYFTTNSLVDVASQFYKRGGKYLFLDEVHKYPQWSIHIKNLYDFHRGLHIVFTGSSIIDISREQGDLSRRVLMYELHGLSYREYLLFTSNGSFPPVTLSDILSKKKSLIDHFPTDFKPLKLFPTYLKNGYYPFSLEDPDHFGIRIQQLIRTIVEYDMADLHDFDIRNAKKMLQLLYILSANVPFKPNLKQLAEKSGIHRNTVINYLHFLEEARLIRLLYPSGFGTDIMQKPEKIYLDNSSLAFALAQQTPNPGNIRETFFASQLKVGHKVAYPSNGDFIVDNQWLFEVGGAKKTFKQIADLPNSFIAADDLEFGNGNKIPLWLFGMLY